jgi:hypothetical protein
MALDLRDFADTIDKTLKKPVQQVFSIVFNGLQNNVAVVLGQEVELNISPCDGIWMPTYFDGSIAQMPENCAAFCGPLGAGYPNFSGVVPPIGMNLFDVWTANEASGNTGFVQLAHLFAIRINNVANPWMLFGLSTCLSAVDNGGVDSPGPCGQGDTMRALSGPISKLWIKVLRFGATTPSAGDPLAFGPVNLQAFPIVLMGTLGLTQTTVGSRATSSGGTTEATYGYQSGGYTQTNLTALDKLKLGTL